jgi:hypothetical protein
MLATKICLNCLGILTKGLRLLSSCWPVVWALYLLRLRWLIYLEIVQNRALDEVMRSVLTTRCLADSASLILRTVSTIMDIYIILIFDNELSTGI